MKRTITTLALTAALLLTVGVGSSFARSTVTAHSSATLSTSAGDDAPAYFHRDFQQAELLDTKTNANYTRITFKLDGAVMSAYYSPNGDLLAITHNITSTQLPMPLLMQVKSNYADYWISDLFELNANGESNYYITLENANKKITLRSSESNWEVYDKSTKN